MQDDKHTILLVEDDEPQRKTLAGFLRKRGYEVLEAESSEQAGQMAAEQEIDLLVSDLRLGGPDGIQLLDSIKEHNPDIQALILSAYGTVSDAVRAMRSGAYDFLTKPVDLERLEALIEKSLRVVTLSKENRDLKEVVKISGVFDDLVGQSNGIMKVKELAARVAPSRASVMIQGESGTGKEVLARSIHRASPRGNKPFVVLNCAALPESLIESELFGHEKGAFTGAVASKTGRFELAHGGTLFLDEVGDIPLSAQVKLLNVIQSGRFTPVGGSSEKHVDVRIITATHRDLQELMDKERFRSDLYYRLCVVTIDIPPLRQRAQDIPILMDHFIRKHSDMASVKVNQLDQEVLEHLMKWPFPGNVRELENWVERAVVLSRGETLTKEDFPPQLFEQQASGQSAKTEAVKGMSMDEQVARLEISLINKALKDKSGNKSAAARQLSISERTIRYKINKYGL